MIETSSVLPRKSSEFRKCWETIIWPSDNFWRIFGNLRKIVKNSSLVCLYNKQNNTWLLVWTWYLMSEREISSSTREEKFHIYKQPCIILYMFNRGCYCLCNRLKTRNKNELARKWSRRSVRSLPLFSCLELLLSTVWIWVIISPWKSIKRKIKYTKKVALVVIQKAIATHYIYIVYSIKRLTCRREEQIPCKQLLSFTGHASW